MPKSLSKSWLLLDQDLFGGGVSLFLNCRVELTAGDLNLQALQPAETFELMEQRTQTGCKVAHLAGQISRSVTVRRDMHKEFEHQTEST